MTRWQNLLISPKANIRKAMQAIQKGGYQLALVVDSKNKLLGTCSDGDIRAALIQGAAMTDSIEALMHTEPTVALLGTPHEEILALMTSKTLRQIPIVTRDGVVCGIELMDRLLSQPRRSNRVILMVGGLGNRLRPLTDDCPKPLLSVRGRPILEWIIEGFTQYGFHRFTLAANYKAEMIQSHFGNGTSLGVEIDYLVESKRLGTAGPLSILKDKPTEPFFVMNGDLIAKANFSQLMDFHLCNFAMGTMCIQNFLVEVPYGVVQTKGVEVRGIIEKPSYELFINSGIYVFSPKVLTYLEPNEPIDIPEFLEILINDKQRICGFPINSFWLDIAYKQDLDKAQSEAPYLSELPSVNLRARPPHPSS